MAPGIGSSGMKETEQSRLFELPAPEARIPSERSQRGRNREMWRLTATADVDIIDPAALREAAAGLEEGFVVTLPGADPGAEDAEPEAPDAVTSNDPFDALAWLIWPTAGLQGALDIGAVRVVSAQRGVVAESDDHGTATWTVTVKLKDVEALRRLAAQAHPEEAAEIGDSLAVAWQRAGDPFAPLSTIDGITWKPGPVVIEHLPARVARSR